jgi:outer membrane protein OmpA-like peptidoglycan-associated protein
VELGAEAGVRSTGGVEVGEDAARVQLDSALGTAIEVTEAIALVAEASGTVSPGIASPVALEPLATLRVRNKAGLTVRAGAGAGVLGGMGEPDWRLLAGIQWIPEAAQPQLRLSSQYDSDRDGIPNDRDRCVEQAEDFNGVADDDGCPEAGLIPPTIEVVDQTGRLVADASLEVMSGPTSGSWRLTRGSWNRSIPAGAYRVKVAALGHRPLELNLEVPETTTWSTRITMESVVSPGRVRVVVTDANGRATPARIELVSPDEKSEHRAEDGVWAGALPAGTYTLNVAAKGLVPVERVISVEPERTLEVTLALSAGQVRIEGDQIVFTDRIFFEQGSDIIQRRSFPLLDEIAATMVRHPELRVVAVHGHTDDQGSESYNLDLSLRRAMAVVQFLEASGVEQSRLQAFGMGEATPLLAGPSAEARAANRRVEFRIVQRTPSKASN